MIPKKKLIMHPIIKDLFLITLISKILSKHFICINVSYTMNRNNNINNKLIFIYLFFNNFKRSHNILKLPKSEVYDSSNISNLPGTSKSHRSIGNG
jgi:hypothetical protein